MKEHPKLMDDDDDDDYDDVHDVDVSSSYHDQKPYYEYVHLDVNDQDDLDDLQDDYEWYG